MEMFKIMKYVYFDKHDSLINNFNSWFSDTDMASLKNTIEKDFSNLPLYSKSLFEKLLDTYTTMTKPL